MIHALHKVPVKNQYFANSQHVWSTKRNAYNEFDFLYAILWKGIDIKTQLMNYRSRSISWTTREFHARFSFAHMFLCQVFFVVKYSNMMWIKKVPRTARDNKVCWYNKSHNYTHLLTLSGVIRLLLQTSSVLESTESSYDWAKKS